MALYRIDKIISACGKASRREVKALLKEGRVTAGGRNVRSPDEKFDPEKDDIRLDGERLSFEEKHYFVMNKPAGYVSSTDDPRDKTVLELVPEEYTHLNLFPAGRLDKDAEGLLILTDDGQYCHNVISPKKNVFKKYYVRVDGMLGDEDVTAFGRGFILRDGTRYRPGKLEIISENEGWVYISEGKFHQVKRSLESLGKPVIYLRRVKIGGLELPDGLELGKMKKLLPEEANLVFFTKSQEIV